MGEAQNAVNPFGFTSILTKPQQKILVPKSDSSLNALAIDNPRRVQLESFFKRYAMGIIIFAVKTSLKIKKIFVGEVINLPFVFGRFMREDNILPYNKTNEKVVGENCY